MSDPSLGFIACIENNKLASEALLLFRSIRHFGGSLAHAPIYSFNPRGLGSLDKQHYEELQSLAVRHSDDLLNFEHRDYALANKIYAAACAEKKAAEDLLVFLDSDSIMLAEPTDLLLSDGVLAAATPVWAAGIGSRGVNDPANKLWDVGRNICGVIEEPPRVETLLTRERVIFYCNGGLIAVRRSAGIFSRWLNCFEQLSANELMSKLLSCGAGARNPSFFLEQMALSLALAPYSSATQLLDKRYNCPLHNRHVLERLYPDRRFDLDSIVHFHYNQSLHKTDFLHSFTPAFDTSSAQYRWLSPQLPLAPLVRDVDDSQAIARFDEQMERWRYVL